MKISKSKQELARIISENGGWREMAGSAAQCAGGEISFWRDVAKKRHGEDWRGSYLGSCEDIEFTGVKLPNWHQTILSREEYFHLYPAPDADGWIEWNGGECPVGEGDLIDVKLSDGDEFFDVGSDWDWGVDAGSCNIIAYRLHKHEKSLGELCGESEEENKHEYIDAKPTIEQLAADHRNAKDCADRKQQEADDAKADAEAKLAELVAAGKELGLVLSVVAPESELVITDWWDLKVGDIIQCVGSWEEEKTDGMQLPVMALEGPHYNGDLPIRVDVPGISYPDTWGINFKFIRRP